MIRKSPFIIISLSGEASDSHVSQVARKCQVSKRTIWHWYKKLIWRERVEQRNIENAIKLQEKTNKAIVKSKADYRAIIGKVVKQF